MPPFNRLVPEHSTRHINHVNYPSRCFAGLLSWVVEQIALDPVDGVHITTLVDNSCDVLLPDRGLVRRWGLAGTAGEIPVLPHGYGGGWAVSLDFLRAEHGFSALIELRNESGSRRGPV